MTTKEIADRLKGIADYYARSTTFGEALGAEELALRTSMLLYELGVLRGRLLALADAEDVKADAPPPRPPRRPESML